MRIRPSTWAILWYPLACAAITGGLGAWLWTQCAGARRPEACRSDIVPGMGLFFLVILAIGLIVLAIVWLVGRLIGRSSRDAGTPWADDASDPVTGADASAAPGASSVAASDPQPMIDLGSDSDPARRG